MATLSHGKKWGRYGSNALDSITGGIGDLEQRTQGPYVRMNEGWDSKLNPADWIFGGIGDYDQAAELRNALRSQITDPNALAYWDSMSAEEQDALLENYYTEDGKGLHNLWGFTGTSDTFDKDLFLKDLGEYGNIEVAPLLEDYVNIDKILADAQASVDAENERLLASLNEDLQRSGDAFTQARDAMLTSQHQRNAQTMDTMASDMSRARRNAIEAGASAGIRIAGNVNALLSAQNKMSQQSLDTSNQLAQMLLNQRNAEAGLRNQWRDAQMSTYDRVQGRAQNEINIGQQRYNQAQESWQRRNDANVSETNALQDSMLKHKQRSAYSNRGSGSAY